MPAAEPVVEQTFSGGQIVSKLRTDVAEEPLAAPRVAVWHHLGSAVLIGLLVGAAGLRLNDCDLFNPDSPRYLIYAQGMLNQGEYRAIDVPGQPVYSWRPPGLPLLLTPALMFRPYDVVAAKWMVLAAGGLLLLAVHGLVCLHGGRGSAPMVLALVGSSPLWLVLSTEVLSEVPYTLAVLALLYWLGRVSEREQVPNTLRFAAVFVTLMWLPAIRTIGVSLVLAAGVWSLASRWRRPYLMTAVLAAASIYWRVQHGRAGGDNYSSSLFESLRERGLSAVLAEAWQTCLFYAAALPGVLFPGLTAERPFYAMLSLDPLPTANGSGPLLATACVVLLLLGLSGVWIERRRTGGLVLLYLPLYLGCLAVWPWRHERFLWPLIPLLWVYVPVGASAWRSRFRPATQRGLTLLSVLAVAALCHRQALNDAALIATNLRATSDRDAFHERELPGFYFSDWRGAGTWLREHSDPSARLLTWHAAVGGTAHRFQRRVALESLSPEALRGQIASFSARYLVVNDSQFGDGFNGRLLSADPAVTLKVIYRERGVAVLEVEPNRSGAISRTAHDETAREQLARVNDFLREHPGRHDLRVRRAGLLRELGQNAEAIAELQALAKTGHATARVCADLGWALFEERRYADAAQWLETARGLPNSEGIAGVLTNGIEQARARMRETSAEAAAQQTARALNRIRGQIAALQWTKAEQEVDQLLASAPGLAAAQYWRGYLHHALGDAEAAAKHYELAEAGGSEEAQAKLELLKLDRLISASRPDGPVDGEKAVSALSPDNLTETNRSESVPELNSDKFPAATFADHVRLAKLLDEQGWPGRAVAVLEAARNQFGDRAEILAPLADLYRRFARPDEAVLLYRLAQKDWPHDKAIRTGLAAAQAALREPKF